MTHLRQLMLDELQRRNYSQSTTRCYLHAVEDFAKYFHRSPYHLGPDHIRQYQVRLFRDLRDELDDLPDVSRRVSEVGHHGLRPLDLFDRASRERRPSTLSS